MPPEIPTEEGDPHRQHAWRPAIAPPLQQQVMRVISCLAERFADRAQVQACVRHLPETYWLEGSLATGFPGLALFFLYLARHTRADQWFDLARASLFQAVQATHARPLATPGLAQGSSGFAMALACFSQEHDRWQAASQKLDRQVAQQVLRSHWVQEMAGIEVFPYDAISGVAGVLGYFVSKAAPEPVIQEAIGHLLQLLVRFVAGRNGAYDPQGWAVPGALFPGYRPEQPTALVINCGLAHGVPGPLAALSLAHQAGYRIGAQPEAIHALATWLAEQRRETAWGIDWPATVAITPVARMDVAPAKSAWCYGAPGLIRSLWLAGQALDNESWQHVALEGMLSALRRPVPTRRIDPFTLCHGGAGLLLICLRFLHDTGHPTFQAHIPTLVTQILQDFHPEWPFGWRSDLQQGRVLDSPGLLIGSAGTGLALLAASTALAPLWERALLIA